MFPTTNAARNGMARNPEGFDYDVSVVVFHKRSLPIAVPGSISELNDAMSREREVSAKIISTGPNGGQILLADMGDVSDPNSKPISPFDQLKVGQWIMLCGPHPNSSTNRTAVRIELVSSAYPSKGRGLELNADGTESLLPPSSDPDRRLVTVRGSQWPWQSRSIVSDHLNRIRMSRNLSNDLCVGIFKGAVAVHSKTLRLESQAGNAFGSGMSTFTPPNVPPGYTVY